ncbi:MAG TPA: DNA repair protein RadC, partial [Thermoanaerobaculia bacterium]
ERPRERLLRHGAQTLSNTELLAILLGCGVRGKNAIQLARMLLGEGLPKLGVRDPAYLQDVCGIGPAKAARLAAAFELRHRFNSDEPPEPQPFDHAVLGPQLVSSLAKFSQERLGAAFLDARHRIVAQREIYVGTINNALVSTRDVIRHALLDHAASAVVVYHNHPSGDPAPSEEDLRYTQKLKESLSLVDINLVDHLVIGAHRYSSMQAQGRL